MIINDLIILNRFSFERLLIEKIFSYILYLYTFIKMKLYIALTIIISALKNTIRAFNYEIQKNTLFENLVFVKFFLKIVLKCFYRIVCV